MAEDHFLAAGEFPSMPLFSSGHYALPPPPQPGPDIASCAAAMTHFGMLSWASELPLPSDSTATATTAAHFDSALSSLVSSPAHTSIGDDVAIGDLIGRLGGICSNAAAASANNSCYSTPLSSPPHGGSMAFRQGGCYPLLETAGGGRLSRVASSTSLGAAAGPALESPADVETSPATASCKTGPGAAQKRKAASGKGKTATAVTNGCPKRPKVAGDGNEDVTAAAADDKKPESEPVKDYIHVRARRGQATDSHRLAERVRREKISERMNLLRSLVPGCNKVTGKALMLDEIINYVQSLQRQVEFLSMKLSTMNPQPDVDAQYPPSDRDIVMMHHQQATLGYPLQDAFSYGDPFAMHPTTMESCTSSAFHPGAGGFGGWETTADHLHDNQQQLPSPPAQPGHGFHGEQHQQQKERGDREPHEGGAINARLPPYGTGTTTPGLGHLFRSAAGSGTTTSNH